MAKNRPPRASRWLRFKRFMGWAPEQSPRVWCPRCGNELVSDPRTKSEMKPNGGLLEYRCGECSSWSAWDFGAPVPLLIHTQGEDRRAEDRGP
jgi:DNA-directed RNA polymerase subunit RPC12/RpoP